MKVAAKFIDPRHPLSDKRPSDLEVEYRNYVEPRAHCRDRRKPKESVLND